MYDTYLSSLTYLFFRTPIAFNNLLSQSSSHEWLIWNPLFLFNTYIHSYSCTFNSYVASSVIIPVSHTEFICMCIYMYVSVFVCLSVCLYIYNFSPVSSAELSVWTSISTKSHVAKVLLYINIHQNSGTYFH